MYVTEDGFSSSLREAESSRAASMAMDGAVSDLHLIVFFAFLLSTHGIYAILTLLFYF